jgi:hypothetical protein
MTDDDTTGLLEEASLLLNRAEGASKLEVEQLLERLKAHRHDVAADLDRIRQRIDELEHHR